MPWGASKIASFPFERPSTRKVRTFVDRAAGGDVHPDLLGERGEPRLLGLDAPVEDLAPALAEGALQQRLVVGGRERDPDQRQQRDEHTGERDPQLPAGPRDTHGERLRRAARDASRLGVVETLEGDEQHRLALLVGQPREGGTEPGRGARRLHLRIAGRGRHQLLGQPVTPGDAAPVRANLVAGHRVQPRQRVLDLAGQSAPGDHERVRREVVDVIGLHPPGEISAHGGAMTLVQLAELALAAHTRFCRDHAETLQRTCMSANAPALVRFGARRD